MWTVFRHYKIDILYILWTIYSLYTGIGRKNETDYTIWSNLTSYSRHPKPSFYCDTQAVHNFNYVLEIWFGMCPNCSTNGAPSHSFCLSLYNYIHIYFIGYTVCMYILKSLFWFVQLNMLLKCTFSTVFVI